MERQVVCIGEVLVDLFAETAGGGPAPIAGADVFRPCLGGAPANVAVALARQGVPAALLARVGRDAFGDFLLRGLASEGVSTELMARVDARTGLAFVARDGDGERQFLFYREGGADTTLSDDDLGAVAEGGATWRALHLCGNGLAFEPVAGALRAAVAQAAAEGVPISLDLNLRFHLWPSQAAADAAVRPLLPSVSFLKADLEEAQVVSGEADPLDAARSLFALGPRLVCVTLGAEGAVYCCDAGAGQVTAPKVDVVDTTGAGDAFSATLLAGLLRHDLAVWGSLDRDEIAHLVRRACVAGARVCRYPGATAGLPSSRDLDEAEELG